MSYFDQVMSRLSDGALITLLIILVALFIASLFRSKPPAKPSKPLNKCPMCGQGVKS